MPTPLSTPTPTPSRPRRSPPTSATFLGLVAGTLGYGVKSFLGYLRTQQKYQLSLTRSLYYQNLDNNAGVLFRLLDEAEEQECRESLLAYFFLWRRAGADGWPAARLDGEIEAFLVERTGALVDFEVADAAAKLCRLGLAEAAADGRLSAVPIHEALAALDRNWDNLFRFDSSPAPAGAAPPADPNDNHDPECTRSHVESR